MESELSIPGGAIGNADVMTNVPANRSDHDWSRPNDRVCGDLSARRRHGIVARKIAAFALHIIGAGIAIVRHRIQEVGGVFELIGSSGGLVVRAAVPRRVVIAQASD
jgi:hypothetical protein